MLQDDASPWLGGAVASDDVPRRVRCEGAGYERGRVRHYGVEDDREAVRGAGQDHTDDSSVLQTTDLRKDPERVFWVWRVQLQRLLHNVDLELEGLIVEACAAARGLFGRAICKGADETGCWRGVSDAHVA